MGLFWYLTIVKIPWMIFFKNIFYSLIGYITLLKLTIEPPLGFFGNLETFNAMCVKEAVVS